MKLISHTHLFFSGFVFILTSLIHTTSYTQSNGNNILEKIIALRWSEFEPYINKREYQVQIIYTQIIRDKNQVPTLKTYEFKNSNISYFYPASLVKLPTAALALEKVNILNKNIKSKKRSISKFTRMGMLPSSKCSEMVVANLVKDTNPPTLAQYIERMFLVSDNSAYSRLYDFIGQKELNDKMQEKGYNSRIVRRFSSGCYSEEQNRYSNPIVFFDKNLDTLYFQPELYCPITPPHPLGKVHIGKRYKDDFSGNIIAEPLDMSSHNYYTLSDVHKTLIALMLPSAVSQKSTFNLSKDDYKFLRESLSGYPSGGRFTKYAREAGYFDAYKKYLLYGREENAKILPNVKIFNVVGLGYGFVSDCAYIVDFENNVEFFVSANIYTNQDETVNDDKYEYDTVAFPFMKLLGKSIYQYELAIEKKYKSKLSHLK